MAYRTAAHYLYILLHTVVCERGIFDDLYITHAELDGTPFRMCWHEDAKQYFEHVIRSLKSILRVSKRSRIILTLYDGTTYKAMEDWTFDVVPNAQYPVTSQSVTAIRSEITEAEEGVEQLQVILSQIVTSASYMPALEPGPLKVSLSAPISILALPHGCSQYKSNAQLDSNPVPLRSIYTKGYSIHVQVSSNGQLSSPLQG